MAAQPLEFALSPSRATIAEDLDPDYFRTIASAAERVGFDAIWAGDHVTIPAEIRGEYPFSASGDSPFDVSQAIHDVFLSLADLCQQTDDIRLGTNVCIVPYRHPVLLTRQVLTLAALSGGRFELGVGVGWLETEFEVLDVPFGDRGSLTDEFLALFEAVCRDGQTAFDGPHHSLQETGFYPVPEDPIPVWVGGHSGATFRRIAEYGTGWTIVWERPDAIRSARRRIMDAWSAYDREGEPEIALFRPVHVGSDPARDTDRPFVGEPANIVDDIEAYREAGVTRIVLDFYEADLDAQLDQLGRLGDEVLPEFR